MNKINKSEANWINNSILKCLYNARGMWRHLSSKIVHKSTFAWHSPFAHVKRKLKCITPFIISGEGPSKILHAISQRKCFSFLHANISVSSNIHAFICCYSIGPSYGAQTASKVDCTFKQTLEYWASNSPGFCRPSKMTKNSEWPSGSNPQSCTRKNLLTKYWYHPGCCRWSHSNQKKREPREIPLLLQFCTRVCYIWSQNHLRFIIKSPIWLHFTALRRNQLLLGTAVSQPQIAL